jgi:hypothetical protein
MSKARAKQPKMRADYLTRFQPQGEIPMAKSPLCVRMPEAIDAIIRAKADRTDWLRDAVMEKLWREGDLPEAFQEWIEDSDPSGSAM